MTNNFPPKPIWNPSFRNQMRDVDLATQKFVIFTTVTSIAIVIVMRIYEIYFQ